MRSLDSSLAEILNNRLMELFQISLKTPLRPALCAQDKVPFAEPVFHASIGIKGEGIEGNLVITADQKFLHQTHPERRYGGILDNSDYLDWAAEISNRTLAGSKPLIQQAMGYQLRLEQPVAKQAPAAPLAPDVRELVQVLESDGLHVMVSLRLKKLEARTPKGG